ncbi:hypothetical protein [Embleya sp. NPDC020630]|uniref:hypothetical protein n=1 Tax=Embleya sp. NPDC020630 TaxID=3363979 RepID=UPI0037BDC6B4
MRSIVHSPQLARSGALDGLRGEVLGQSSASSGTPTARPWADGGIVDVPRDRLGPLGIPVLGGIPAGHGPHPPTIPLGTEAALDTAAGTLTIQAAVV